MSRRFITYIILTATLVFASCTKESTELLYANQETKIDSFVESTLSKNPSYTVTYNNGSVRITVVEGTGEGLEKKESASIYYAGYTFSTGISTSNLFVTNVKEIADQSGWKITDDSVYEPVVISPSDDNIVEGLANGLIGAKTGEECLIIFSGKYGFGKKQNGTISANSAIAYHVWVRSISD